MKPTALRSYHVRTNIASSMKLGIWETSRVHVMMMIQVPRRGWHYSSGRELPGTTWLELVNNTTP
jgi:hypothetical protein